MTQATHGLKEMIYVQKMIFFEGLDSRGQQS